MKKIFAAIIPFVFIISCSKKDNVEPPPPAHPPMKYTNLGNVAIKFGQVKTLDINGDNTVDLIFSTMAVGDPLFKRDKKRYYANGRFDVFSLVNEGEETPVLNTNDSITVQNHAGYNWYNASSIILAEKIIEETGPPYWQGNWKNASHKFFAVQVRKDNLLYSGWVEASFNTNTEELILHRAAVATVPGKNIVAGK
jgi:hypothetical protein